MSERIVSDPSLHGWVEVDGKWVWDVASGGGSIQDGDTQGQVTTWDTASGEWTPDSSVKVRPDIGMELTGSAGRLQFESSGAKIRFSRDAKNYIQTGTGSNSSLVLGANDAEALTLDATGNATFSGTVKSSLSFDGRDGLVISGSINGDGASSGLGFIAGAIHPLTGASAKTDSTDLGSSTYKFKDAYFSGTVDAAGFTVNGSPIGGGHSGNNLVIENESAPVNQKKWRLNVNTQTGRLRIQNLNDDNSNKQVDFIKFNQDNTIEAVGSITAPDFIATSDERVKDNITTAPVGLIDSLKGREWEWRESGEKGSGVVAQELEQVLPHLVHTDDDGMKSVSYMGLCAYLIEEVKALRAEVEALK